MYSLSFICWSHWQISCPDICMFSRCCYLLAHKIGGCPIQPYASILSRFNLLFYTFPLQLNEKLSINRSVGLPILICHSAHQGWHSCLLHVTATLCPREIPLYYCLGLTGSQGYWMHAKSIDHLKISNDPTWNRAWNLPSCGLMPRKTATPIIGTPKINGITGDTNSKPLGAVRVKINTGFIMFPYICILCSYNRSQL